MKKRIIALILSLMMLISILPTEAFAADPVQITIGNVTANAGETISVPVTISGASNARFANMIISFSVPSGLSISSAIIGAEAATAGMTIADTSNYSAGIIIVKGNAATGCSPADGTLLTLQVKLDATATGSYTITGGPKDDNAGNISDCDEENVVCTFTSGTITVGSSGEDDSEIPTNVNYTADLGLPTGASTAVKVGDEVTVNILVGGTSNQFASSELNLTYEGLTYVPGESTLNGADVTAANGAIKIIDHGDTTTWTEGGNATAYSLVFTVDSITGASGTASITLSDAALSKAADASGSNLTPATVTVNTKEFTVTPADLKVTLSEDFNGATSVVYGEDYTFTAKDPNYDYVITVTGGNEATYNESTKTWTVADVTSDLTINATKTAKKFSVSIDTEDNFATVPTTGANAATYKVDYTFTLKANEAVKDNGESGWTYTVDKITIGGVEYTASNSGQTYTIAGTAITGDIVITTKKTEVKPDEYTITVNRTDVSNTELVVNPSDKVATDGSISLTLTPVAGYEYTVTYKIGDGEAQNVTWTDGANGTKTATISGLTGHVTITASKTVDASQFTVTVVNEYVAMNGQTVHLVRVSATLDNGYVLTYGGDNMYWSTGYAANGEYVYLVITDADATLSVADATAQIDIDQGTPVATITYDGNVNLADTTTIDANDAQLVWNMYKANVYSDFDTAATGATMEKYLRADVDKDGDVDVDDASAVVTAVKNRTN